MPSPSALLAAGLAGALLAGRAAVVGALPGCYNTVNGVAYAAGPGLTWSSGTVFISGCGNTLTGSNVNVTGRRARKLPPPARSRAEGLLTHKPNSSARCPPPLPALCAQR